MLKVKRAYETPQRSDGARILVERLWPRGVSKEKADLDLWLKEIAPSPELRDWFKHDPAKWEEFRRRYWRELKAHPDLTDVIREQARRGDVTLVYGSRDEQHNSALVLKEYLEQKRDPRSRPTSRR